MIELLQDGDFESIVAEESTAVELAENIAAKAPGLAGKIYGNLSSAYLQLRRSSYTSRVRACVRACPRLRACVHACSRLGTEAKGAAAMV